MTHADVGNPSRTEPEEPTPSPDLAFDLLANERRLALVGYLLDANRPVAVEELVDALADTEAERSRVAVTLHHAHLPKLAAAGAIERDGDYVEPTPLLDDLEPFLRAVATFEGQVR